MLDDLLGNLLELGLAISFSQDGVTKTVRKYSVIGLDISVKINTVGTVESWRLDNIPSYRFVGTEPVVDVIMAKNAFKIIIVFPGIRQENVHFSVKDDIVEVKISKNGYIFRKEIPHSAKAEQISIKSSTINNSVLEATFIKK